MRLFVKSVLQGEPWKYDSKVVPMPWRQAEEDSVSDKIARDHLTLGFYNCDGVVSSSSSAEVLPSVKN
jgi:amidase